MFVDMRKGGLLIVETLGPLQVVSQKEAVSHHLQGNAMNVDPLQHDMRFGRAPPIAVTAAVNGRSSEVPCLHQATGTIGVRLICKRVITISRSLLNLN